MISWFQVAVGLIGLITALMTWLNKRSLISAEQSRQLAATLDEWATGLRAAADARDAVRRGGGVRVEQDPFNRDLKDPGT